MRIPGAEKARNNLLKWSSNAKWGPVGAEILAEHLEPVRKEFELDIDAETLMAMFGPAAESLLACVLEDFFTARFGEESENVIDDYLARRGWRESVPGKRYLESLRDSVMSLYEVVDLEPGRSLTVRDLIRGGEPITVAEKLGSETAAIWDRFAARIVIVNGKTHFTGSLLLFRHEIADALVSSFKDAVDLLAKEVPELNAAAGKDEPVDERKLRDAVLRFSVGRFTGAWLMDAFARLLTPPQVCNGDGHDIVLSKSCFPLLVDQEAVVAALEATPGLQREAPEAMTWGWLSETAPAASADQPDTVAFDTRTEFGETLLGHVEIKEAALHLTSNSVEREEQGRALLLAHLDGMLGEASISHEELEMPGEGHEEEEVAGTMPELPFEDAEAVLAEVVEEHYRRVLDEPLPYLDGKTPREAAMTEDGRAGVIGWLKLVENSESRRAASLGQKPVDFRWMWQEMNLSAAR